MIDFRYCLFCLVLLICFACNSKAPQDMSIEELDGHIHDLKYLLDSIETIREYKVAQDTTGEYISSKNRMTEIDDIFENKSVVFVKGKVDSSVSISKFRITQDRPYQRDFIQSVMLDEDGAFTEELDILKNGLFSLKFGTYDQEIYLENGKTVGILIDSLSHSGVRFIGDLSEENNFLVNKHEDFQNQYNSLFRISSDNLEESKALIENVKDSIHGDYSNLLSVDMSPSFKDIINKRIALTEARVLLAKAQQKKTQIDDAFFQPQHISLDADNLFNLYEFRKYLFEYFEYKADAFLVNQEFLDVDQVDYWNQKYSLVSQLFKNQTITDFLKTDVIFESIAKIRSTTLNSLIRKFEDEVKNPAYLSTINNRYNSILNPRKGTIAPDIIGKTFDGEDFNLAQMKGKYVYIFVWATWCGPCKIEIPYYERMIEDYTDANIEFVGISVDRSKKKWIESFFYNEYPGLQVLVPGDWKSPIVTDYKIRSIPQFILIDPTGEIVELNAERPTKNIKAQLSQYGLFPKTY